MSEQNSNNNQLVPFDQNLLDSITFDSFPRTSADIICVAPTRTIIRREEEYVIIRRVRKVEEVDGSAPTCPVPTIQVSPVQQAATIEEKKSTLAL